MKLYQEPIILFDWKEYIGLTTYKEKRYEYIKIGEGLGLSVSGKSDDLFEAYTDTVGIPTIGIGFNLKADEKLREAILRKIYETNYSIVEPKLTPILTATYTSTTSLKTQRASTQVLRDKINAALEDIRRDNPKLDIPAFRFTGERQVKDFFDTHPSVAEEYEKRLDGRLVGLKATSVPTNTEERLALLSLTWNGGPRIIGSGVGNALNAGNRALVWFEIRYGSNLKKEHSLALRRYFEADLFGLYHYRTSATEAEARNVAAMYGKHHAAIRDYDNLTFVGKDGEKHTFETLIPNVNTKYKTNIVQPRCLAFQPAVDKLLALYPEAKLTCEVLADNLPDQPQLNTTEVPPLSGSDSNELLLGIDQGSVLEGNAGNDTIIGGRSSDILRGGPGDDILRGGDGIDRLEGGMGFDRYRHLDSQTVDQYNRQPLPGSPGVDIIAKDSDGVIEVAVGNNLTTVEGDFYPHSSGSGYVESTYNPLLLRLVGEGLEISNNQVTDPNATPMPDAARNVYIEQFTNGDLNINLLSAACRDAGDYIGNGNSILNIVGTCGTDRLFNSADNGSIDAREGNDVITAAGKGMYVSGGSGNDTIYSGNGVTVDAGPGRDSLYLSAGSDIVHGDLGDDYISDNDNNYTPDPSTVNELYGDDGNDTLVGQNSKYHMYGGKGDDFFYIQGVNGSYSSPADNILDGGEDNDRFEVRNAPATFIGGKGINTYTITERDLLEGHSYVIKDAANSLEDRVFIITNFGTIPVEEWVTKRKAGKYTYDGTSKTLHVHAGTATTQDAGIAQSGGEILIENFAHNGIFRIENVPGAPPAPWQIPVAEPSLDDDSAIPELPGPYRVHIPIILQATTAQTQSGEATMAHPVTQQHPEQQAYTLASDILLIGSLVARATLTAAPRRFFQPIHRTFLALQTELDLARIRIGWMTTALKMQLARLKSEEKAG